MSENYPEDLRTVDFQLAVEYELNQKPGKLKPLVGDEKPHTGKGIQLIDRYGDINLEEKQNRNEDTNYTSVDVTRRWIKKPKSADAAQLIDRDDARATKVDMHSPISVQMAKGVLRYHDDKWLEGYFGPAYVGEEGDTTVPFNSSNIIPHGSTGFTKAKLLSVREEMLLNDVDMEAEMPICLIDPLSETELLSIEEYIKADYTPGHALVRGEIKPWLGFRFIRSNLTSSKAYPVGSGLVVPGANQVALPVFVLSGLYRGVWEEFWGDVGPNRAKKRALDIFAEACSAVTRVDEDKCYQMVVDHS